jgi:hypothetical protein
MKNKKRLTFIEELRNKIRALKKMRPSDVHVISVNASFGHYQIIIGPESHSGPHHVRLRPIEINGEIHHLFLSPSNIGPQPSREQMRHNMRNTVIMRHLNIHLSDPTGDGKHLHMPKHENGMHAGHYINLAGDKGRKMLDEAEHSRRYALAAYRIVQKDILDSLKDQ